MTSQATQKKGCPRFRRTVGPRRTFARCVIAAHRVHRNRRRPFDAEQSSTGCPASLTAAIGPDTSTAMSEEKMVEVINDALASAGIEDTVIAAGEFSPRGHSGAGFAGGLIGGGVGDAIGSPAGGIGVAGGYLAGTSAHDDASGLPGRMVLGVSATTVYGFAGNRAHPKALVFRLPQAGTRGQGPPARERARARAARHGERLLHRAGGACACRSRTPRMSSRAHVSRRDPTERSCSVPTLSGPSVRRRTARRPPCQRGAFVWSATKAKTLGNRPMDLNRRR